MKLSKLFFGVAAAAMFAACSSDDVVSAPENLVKGDGYIAIDINLPTTPMARALNDQYDDGTPNEYKVDDAALFLFVGADAESATLAGAYDLSSLNPENDVDNDNITTSFLKVQKVDNIALGASQHYYALVMLNYHDVCTISGGSATVKTTGSGTVDLSGKSFTEINQIITDQTFYHNSGASANYFFMTNSPLSTQKGGLSSGVTVANLKKANVPVLVQLNDNAIQNTENDAKNNVAGSVFVERAVAKATLSAPTTTTIGGVTYNLGVEWALDNVEPTSYVARYLGTTAQADAYLPYKNSSKDDYRFVGSVAMGETSIQPVVQLFRPYWCVDPHYGADLDNSRTTIPASEFKGKDVPLYCHENTFDVAHQNYGNTTRAVLKVTFNGGTGNLYTINGENRFYSEADAKSYPTTVILESDEVKNAYKAALKASETLTTAEITAATTITFNRDANGILKVTNVALSAEPAGMFDATPVLDATVKATLLARVNNYYEIAEYVNGAAYYDLRFMHFAGTTAANDLAPWSTSAANTPNTGVSYPGADAEKEWLGRWGMVRNNWYDVAVTAINNIGSPVIPNVSLKANSSDPDGPGETPDDNKKTEKYIAFKINVLSWAKRTMGWEF